MQAQKYNKALLILYIIEILTLQMLSSYILKISIQNPFH